MDNSTHGFFGAVGSWLAKPFNSQGSALNWVLWLGLIIIAIWFWQTVLIELKREI